jgi:hypothetical protein
MRPLLAGLTAAALLAAPSLADEPTRYVLEPDAVWTPGDPQPLPGWVVVVDGEWFAAV